MYSATLIHTIIYVRIKVILWNGKYTSSFLGIYKGFLVTNIKKMPAINVQIFAFSRNTFDIIIENRITERNLWTSPGPQTLNYKSLSNALELKMN